MSEDLVDIDGENKAVRSFLMLYGSSQGCNIKEMKEHLTLSGFEGMWPNWAKDEDGHMTKYAAQMWLRYLFSLERPGVIL